MFFIEIFSFIVSQIYIGIYSLIFQAVKNRSGEELSSLIGIYEYFENLYNHHFSNKKLKFFDRIQKVNNLIAKQEENLANPLLKYLSSRKDIKLIGKKTIKNKDRAPTISFTSKKHSSKKISKILNKNFIATRNDNFYAWRCLNALDINSDDGVIRISMTHYNTEKEVKNLIKILDKNL